MPSDPGPGRIPAGAFGTDVGSGFESAAKGIESFAEGIRGAAEKEQQRLDFTSGLEATNTYERRVTEEWQRRQTEDDLSRPGFADEFGAFLKKTLGETIASLPSGVSDDARERLRLKLDSRTNGFSREAGQAVVAAGQKRAEDAVNSRVNALGAEVLRAPGSLDAVLDTFAEDFDASRGVLAADKERDLFGKGRARLILGAVTAHVEAGRFDMAQETLNRKDFDADLDLSARTAAMSLIERGKREHLAQLADDVNDAVFVLDRGRVPPGVALLADKVRGTKYEATLRDAVEDHAAVTEFIKRPLTEQVSAIRAMGAAATTDRRTLEREQRMIRAHTNLANEVRAGRGLEVAAEIGVISNLEPVQIDDPATVRKRAAQARAASEHLGAPVSPFTAQEARAVQGMIDGAPTDDAVRLVAGLRTGLGERASSALTAAWVKERPALGVALSLVHDKPERVREILQGARLLRDNKDVLPGKADRAATVRAAVGDMLTPDTADALDSYVEAANALYAARRVPTGDITFDSRLYEQALRDAMGNPVTFNGRTIIPPVPDMPADQVRDAVRRLTYADLSAFGNGQPAFRDGKPFDPGLFKRSIFGAEAQLVTAGAGKYLVMVPGLGYIASDRGGAYVLDLRAAIEARR